MPAFRRILMAVKDPAKRSSPAVAKAAQLARALDARLELFHAIDTPLFVDAYRYTGRSLLDTERDTRMQCLSKLDRMAEGLRRTGLRVTVAAEWDFPPHEAIVRRAVSSRADLIIAESHAGRRLAPWLFHLTDWELLRLSPVPVLVVKKRGSYRRPVVLAAIDPGHAFAKPAKLDREILRTGARLSAALRGSLHAMHAYQALAPAPLMPPPALSRELRAKLESESLARARTGFERALRGTKLPSARRHLVDRAAADAIPGVAREVGSAIVVMGAVSRSGLGRVFIGNTAERVLAQLPCDVLVVKPPGFTSGVERKPRGVRYVAGALPTF